MKTEIDNLEWQDLQIKTPKKSILHCESGKIEQSSLTALLGSSGAGKTTLLNALAGRLSNVQLRGDIKFNGKDRNQSDWSTKVAYVEQFFFAYGNQTVYETILFAARLKGEQNPSKIEYVELCPKNSDKSFCKNLHQDSNQSISDKRLYSYKSNYDKKGEESQQLGNLRESRFSMLPDDYGGMNYTDLKNPTDPDLHHSKYSHLSKIERNVMKIIDSLGLGQSKDTKLCSLSGGEYKRVSIGVELVGDPSVIFLDEPTSGLDSFNALNTLTIIKKLVDTGKTVLMTIHQPSYEIIKLFDNIFLLSRGASVFQGNIDDCISYFKDIGYSLPNHTNPCEYFLDLISINPLSQETIQESNDRIDDLQRRWADRNKHTHKDRLNEGSIAPNNYNEHSTDRFDLEAPKSHASSVNDNPKERNKKNFRVTYKKSLSSYISFPFLFKRNMLELWRDDKYLKILCIQKIVFTLLVGLTFLQLGYDEDSILSRTGVIFFILINTLFGTSGPILNAFPIEKKIIKRERASGLYDGVTAYLTKFLALLIYNGILTVIYISAVYWMVGLNPNAGRFFIFLIIQLSAVVFSITFGLTIGTLAPSQNVAQVLGPTILITYIVYGGNFNNPENIPGWLRWIIWISPVNYAYRVAFQNQYNGLTFSKSAKGPGMLDFQGGDISGDSIVVKNGLDHPGVWPCILGLWGLTAAWFLLGSVYLHFSTRIKISIKSSK